MCMMMMVMMMICDRLFYTVHNGKQSKIQIIMSKIIVLNVGSADIPDHEADSMEQRISLRFGAAL